MRDDWVPETSAIYSEYLYGLFQKREEAENYYRKHRANRKSLS